MGEINAWAVLAAALVMFVVSSVFYGAFATVLFDPERAEAKPAPWQIAVELLRNVVIATAVAWLVAESGREGWGETMLLALVIWVCFPVTILLGAVTWRETTPVRGGLHMGDWLLKLTIVGTLAGVWR